MIETEQAQGPLRRAWLPARAPRAATVTVIWGVAYAAFGLVCALRGVPLFAFGGARTSPVLDWAVVAAGALAALGCAAAMRYGPRPWLRALLWTACGLSGVAAFSLLMDLITLLVGQSVDSRPAAANHAMAATGALLLAATVRTRHTSAGGNSPPPSPAPQGSRMAAAWAGTAAFLPYIAMKTFWALGGTFAGVSKEEMLAVSERNGAPEVWLTLESWGLDVTVLLAALGIFLLWGLVRPWGQVFPRWTLFLHGRQVPRWLPLGPGLIGAATLAPYGMLGIGYCTLATAGVVTMRPGDFHTTQDALLVAWIGMSAFAVYGIALAAAARSYWLRTRPAGPARRPHGPHAG
ncbi:hypothetical protein ACSNOH_20480 [Streptomyces sp. URMC 127]|uniref:hypothetical protein n=1 Tax=Streptomyces sp. URMC 127 TaxID=3423402 RepID=UPI003F1B0F0A